ncbi:MULTISPECIES: LamG domain-containing protein [Streptacidiphilus]|uniref:LamG domain-containing protein n=2 Tax=Streptacidiphilus TaxID=228398 RepID=A0ABV6UGM7_9ACTN|nr:LamG domain-containing protein [Streptacidiphilus jeojiense]
MTAPQGFGPAPAAFQPQRPAQPQQPVQPQQSAQPGWPAQPTQPGWPAQPGRPVPPPVQQGFGAPAWPPPGAASGVAEPDWSALATQNDKRLKRRRRLLIGGAVVLVLALGAGTGAVLISHGKSKNPVAGPTQSSQPSSPEPVTVGSLAAAVGTTPLGLGRDAAVAPVAGNPGKALTLPSGQDSFAATTAPVVDASKSFTVSARALVDVSSGHRTIVSQGSGTYSSFSLARGLVNGVERWIFKVQLTGDISKSVLSQVPAAAGKWTVLTGSYDAEHHQIQLYVNGTLQGTTVLSGIQPSTGGGLQIGRVRFNSAWADPWHGDISDVALWDRTLTAPEIAEVVAGASTGSAKGVPAPTAAWLTG